MLSLKIEYDVPEDRSLHIQLPAEIKPGKHEIMVVVDNARQSDESPPKMSPADIFMASGFIGCGETDPLLSETYKTKLTEHLREKHGDR